MKKLFMVVAIAVLFAACEKNVEELDQDELMLKGAKKENAQQFKVENWLIQMEKPL